MGQTLETAIECRTPAAQKARNIKNNFIRNNIDMLVTTFGMTHTLKTKVGDDFVRGVSGGERKRVSLAEVVGTLAPLLIL